MACKVSSLFCLRETSKLILVYRPGLSGTAGSGSGSGTSGHQKSKKALKYGRARRNKWLAKSGLGPSGHHSDTSGIGNSGDKTMTGYGSDTTGTGSGLGISGHHSGIIKHKLSEEDEWPEDEWAGFSDGDEDEWNGFSDGDEDDNGREQDTYCQPQQGYEMSPQQASCNQHSLSPTNVVGFTQQQSVPSQDKAADGTLASHGRSDSAQPLENQEQKFAAGM